MENAPGNLANGAVYIFEPEVLRVIVNSPDVSDLSLDVIPHFLRRTKIWKADGVHRDIGTLKALKAVQYECDPELWSSILPENFHLEELLGAPQVAIARDIVDRAWN